MAATFLENLTINPENIRDLRELLQVGFEAQNLADYARVNQVRNGDPFGIIGDLSDVGVEGSGCDPEYAGAEIENAQKRWELGDWQIPLKICYTDMEGTAAEYAFKNGTPIGDLNGTDIMTYVVYPALDRALRKMWWRISWFGDTAADTISNGGVLTNGTDTSLFTITNGFWKKLFAITTNNPLQQTAIAANSGASYAAQKAAILTAGAATGAIDSLLFDADPRITASDDAVLMMTKSLADAFTLDLKNKYNNILPWEEVFSGVRVAQYNGVRVVSIAEWDNVINTYENDGTKWNLPYRAVLTRANNLHVGVTTEGLVNDLDVWFEKKERRMYIYGTGKIGTMIPVDDFVQVGF